MVNIKSYFKLDKTFFKIFAIDFVTFWGLILIFLASSTFWISKVSSVLQGQSVEGLQNFLLTAPIGQVQDFQSDLVTFFAGIIIFMILTLLAITFSRSFVWKTLHKKWVPFYKWFLLALELIIPSTIYFFAFFIVRIILLEIVKFIGNTSYNSIIGSGVYPQSLIDISTLYINVLGMILYLILLFITFASFTSELRVLRAVEKSYHIMRKQIKQISKLFLIATIVAIILSLVLLPFRFTLSYQPVLTMFLNSVLTFMFISWLRFNTSRLVTQK
ncbi:hypothetical protein HOD05_03260 [Candidatus Woesearchaeota archaeon]|jgi:hypothetical protein|nr:hypothetical protein [Candidatus Woesearchaeota archaeon]MBT4151393.1 hypothetical protein [Candidatus Woesearchaeota archaeon]MBT4247791.1 hypothetical protein [Candidatus Woesearchaeota archaeon]MBT4434215.1 hypothetical protein [Candidatus Woesearchaeota archaeon]MBT7332063.1 hypothetical protein [Candidatus Woesearchaeota archaeon]